MTTPTTIAPEIAIKFGRLLMADSEPGRVSHETGEMLIAQAQRGEPIIFEEIGSCLIWRGLAYGAIAHRGSELTYAEVLSPEKIRFYAPSMDLPA